MEFKKRGSTDFTVENLKSLIINSNMQPNEKLPSERKIEAMYDVSRTSVRRAIDILVGEGWVYKVASVGIFTAEPKINIDLTNLSSFTEQMEHQGLKSNTVVIASKIVVPNHKIARELKIEEQSEVLFLKRLRKVSGSPFLLQESYIPTNLAPSLEIYNFEEESLFNILREKYNLEIITGEEKIKLVESNENDSKYFNISIDSTLIHIECTNYDNKGRPIEFIEQKYNPQMVNFSAISNID